MFCSIHCRYWWSIFYIQGHVGAVVSVDQYIIHAEPVSSVLCFPGSYSGIQLE